jgi:tripartite ATP-independent transporter DctM subunit
MGEVGRAARDAVWALMIPVFIIVGLRYGIFTTTEAGAIVVLVTLAIGTLVYRELTWAKLPGVLRETVIDTSSVMLLVCAASAFGFYMAWERMPPQMAAWISGLTQDPIVLLLLINLLLILLGTALEGTAALIILTPIFVPVILKFGIDPVQFGIVLVMNLTIAGITPPVGQMMFISCAVLRVRMETYTVEILPYLGALISVLLLVTLAPGVALWLPNIVMGP